MIKIKDEPDTYPVVKKISGQICICVILNQCCGAGAGGAEIILGPGAGAENKF